tara:strand:+ start:556 stop:741 length:186 start_codon:yes stop_codon:yes gene_type:complete
MSDEVLYVKGPRYLDGVNLDADIISAEPKIIRRQASDPVNDGSLGKPAYVPGSKNLDGTPL